MDLETVPVTRQDEVKKRNFVTTVTSRSILGMGRDGRPLNVALMDWEENSGGAFGDSPTGDKGLLSYVRFSSKAVMTCALRDDR
jgi:hypothetical protein